MTEQNIVAFDPGAVTGLAGGVFSETEPLTITAYELLTYEELRDGIDLFREYTFDHVVAEVFTNRTNNDFAADLTGVRVEGILDAGFDGKVVWRDRTKKSQVPDQILKDHGLWVKGSEVNWTDGRDVNDAIIHMIGYVAFDLRHRPTLEEYFRNV